MTARLQSRLYVQACIRAASAKGLSATVVRKGYDEAGAVLIKLNRLDGTAELLTSSWTGPRGERNWRARPPAPEAETDDVIVREVSRDPDLWVLEVEDREARHPLDEPIDRPG